MDAITLKLPETLHAALNEASRQRGVSKSALVREALETALGAHGLTASAAERWVARWHGTLRMPAPDADANADPRLAHLLRKHVR